MNHHQRRIISSAPTLASPTPPSSTSSANQNQQPSPKYASSNVIPSPEVVWPPKEDEGFNGAVSVIIESDSEQKIYAFEAQQGFGYAI
ncbi:hypothetical protein QVD17_31427 [Tagetes erecta]|uniref:Uncharacterized protein n=1 Tax=Tagetes erecta TaxID=13708 RepID=A0AAD8K3R2_TARER|nr:hypothetical protein QVD17_31427 [Tagetes erecta]